MSYPKAAFLTSAAKPDQYPGHRRTEVALAGRSNVGKSSLINAIANRRGLAYVSKQPGRTQTINFIALDDSLCLVDLPGYGYAEVPGRVRSAWSGMIEAYLTDRDRLASVLVLIDSRHGPTPDDRMMLEWLAHHSVQTLVIASKWDKVAKGARSRRQQEMQGEVGREVVPFSAHTGEGRERILTYLRQLA